MSQSNCSQCNVVHCTQCNDVNFFISRQRRIMKQNRTFSSMYTQQRAALDSNINTANAGAKHDSYQRYLNKKKRNNMVRTINDNIASTDSPKEGNKIQAFFMTYKLVDDCGC